VTGRLAVAPSTTQVAARIDQATTAISQQWPRRPDVVVILGTGLGLLAADVVAEATIPYPRIPHFPRATATSHRGRLVCGLLDGVPVATMEGRLHPYEGYGLAGTAFPVQVLARLGARRLVVSNAAGGMNLSYRLGDIVVIDDHINMMAGHPLSGLGPAAPSRPAANPARVYCPRLIDQALAIARREDFVAHRGVYVGVLGPNYETRAEYRFLRQIGGDVVGMSTVPEVIAARAAGLRVLGLSTVTNICRPDALSPTRAEDVVAAAHKATANLRKIVTGIVADPCQV
jgi:purine-nucleoside phosphorylase